MNVVLILGAGANIGRLSAMAFKAAGFKIAIASRSLTDGVNDDGWLTLCLDLGISHDIQSVFDKVKLHFDQAPNVVIYNGYSRALLPEDQLLSALTVGEACTDLTINATSALVAAKCAVHGFESLPSNVKKTFFFTGNKLNAMPLPAVIAFGMGKTASWHMINALVKGYRHRDFRFYYTDERLIDGTHAGAAVSGEARASLHVGLAELPEQGPWYYTFVKDHGYKSF